MNLVMLVAAHKAYRMPEDRTYRPIQVGAEGKAAINPQWLRDDVRENISGKNASFCELTAYYWAWKNLDADIYGLCHYRRYFGSSACWKAKEERILSEQQITRLLEHADIILPKKRHYFIETRESQYNHAHHGKDLVCVRQILAEKYPEYLPQWNQVMQSRSGHIFNMMIAPKAVFDAYLTWLFDILFEAEKRIDISDYSVSEQRVFGYLAERLLDVYVLHHRLKYVECPVVNMESQHWLKKGFNFLSRKIGIRQQA